ncbi:MAG: hypothetical protein ACI4OG_02285 [Bacilli bacterium]
MKQINNKNYDLIVENNNSYNSVKCNVIQLLKINPKLVVYNENDKLYELDNIQSLYLYPLTIIDYINNLTSKKIINLNIIEIDCNLDYEIVFNNPIFNKLKSVEILIKENYNQNEILKICELIKYFNNKKIMISLNIKNLINMPNLLSECYKYIAYFKIFLPNNIDNHLYTIFLNKLAIISNSKSENSLTHIKTYLNQDRALLYEQMINDFSKLNIDIFQVSKELLPLYQENISVNIEIQNLVRNLELKYNNYNSLKFTSVKNLKELYYPRFELDDRNSKKCYSCYMKPYMYKDKILPCKVNKIFEDLNNWSSNYLEYNKYNDIINRCGTTCDDCASIFENDLLYNIEKILKNNNNVNIYLVKEG